jgi:hypothetical protein
MGVHRRRQGGRGCERPPLEKIFEIDREILLTRIFLKIDFFKISFKIWIFSQNDPPSAKTTPPLKILATPMVLFIIDHIDCNNSPDICFL